jgi:hypothetical protein
MDENELNLEELDSVQENVEKKAKIKNRFEQLSEKLILTTKEKEENIAKVKVAEEAKARAERDLNFYKGFNSNIAKYPQAATYQDQIKERVDKGYDAEEAILAVLAKEGKLTNAEKPAAPPPQVEGGSAPTTFPGNKSLKDMTPDEKLQGLMEADKEGVLSSALRGR